MNQLKEAVIAAVIDSLTETSRAKKNLMRQLADKKNKGKPTGKQIRTFGPKGGDVQRDKSGKPMKSELGKAKLTPAAKSTMKSRMGPKRKDQTGKVDIPMKKAKEAKTKRYEKARDAWYERNQHRMQKNVKEGPYKDRD